MLDFFDSLTGHPTWMSCFALERATRLELAAGIPRIAFGDSQEPCRTSYFDALRAWVEIASSFRLNKK